MLLKLNSLDTVYQKEVDHMIRQFSDCTCISMSVEFNCHLIAPFPALNKTLPKPPSNVDDTEQSSKIDINKNHDISSSSADTKLSSGDSDVTGAQAVPACCHSDVRRTSGKLSLIAAQLLDILQKAVMKRVTLIPDDHKCSEHPQAMCSQSKQSEFHKLSYGIAYNQVTTFSDARVAILFSGGVDSMVLAALADRQGAGILFFLQSLFLTDVCLLVNQWTLLMLPFSRREGSYSCGYIIEHLLCCLSDDCFNVPDRVTALASLTELNQQRNWNLIMVVN